MTNQKIDFTIENLPTLQLQLNEMIESIKELVKIYELFPSEQLQNNIIDLGEQIGTFESILFELKTFGKTLSQWKL